MRSSVYAPVRPTERMSVGATTDSWWVSGRKRFSDSSIPVGVLQSFLVALVFFFSPQFVLLSRPLLAFSTFSLALLLYLSPCSPLSASETFFFSLAEVWGPNEDVSSRFGRSVGRAGLVYDRAFVISPSLFLQCSSSTGRFSKGNVHLLYSKYNVF